MQINEKYKAFAMVGKPGCGKGTQSALLAKETGFEAFSSGHHFRELASRKDALGKKISDIMYGGGLMPYWFASFVFEEKALYTPENEGIIFDGVARKAPEAELFHDVMSWLERPYLAICLDVSDKEVNSRISSRRKVEHREDDEEDAVRVRFEQFQKEVLPAIEVFEKHRRIIHVDGEQEKSKVFEDILEKLTQEELL
jgi:adenylate kinase